MADGSGGTHAGLLAGLGASSATRVVGVDVGTRPDLDEIVPALAAEAARTAGRTEAASTHVIVDHDHVGDGYGLLSDECASAIRVVAQAEGILLDPVYSGKAMAALFDWLRDGRIHAGASGAVLAHRRRTRAVRGAVRGLTHARALTRGRTRWCGSVSTLLSVVLSAVDLDQASRTLYATAAPMARTSRSRRSFFTGVPFRSPRNEAPDAIRDAEGRDGSGARG